MRTCTWAVAVLGVVATLWALLSAPPVHAQRATPANDAGRAIYDARCSTCHGLDARGGEAPTIGPRSNAASSPDARVLQVIRDGLPGGMPGFGALLSSSDITAVLRHLRRLQHASASTGGGGSGGGAAGAPLVAGDPALGRALFFGKANCSQCHLAEGQGGFLGPDLTGVRLDATQIHQAIVRPSASPSGVLADVTLRNGQRITGLVRNEDNFSVQMQDEGGGFHLIDKGQVASLARRAQPLMPTDYEKRLSSTELEALVSYIAGMAAPAVERMPRK